MKAMRLEQPGPLGAASLKPKEVPVPQPGPGQVLIRVSACGICHTDLHVIEGDLPPHRLPVTPGHQIVGVVVEVGEGVEGFEAGTRVGVPWLHRTCGDCHFCRQGKENLCESALFTGYDVDGGYAQYTLAYGEFAYPIPEGFPDVQSAPLLCAGVIGYRALRLAEVPQGGRLGLYGFGASAHIVVQIAVHLGHRVYVFSRSEEHRRLAMKLGAVWVGSAQEGAPERLHSSIIFAPAGNLVPLALEGLEKGGTLALAGIYMSPVPELEYSRHLYHEKVLRSVANSTRKDAQELLQLAAEIPLRTQVQVYPLEQANEALSLLKEGKIQGAGVLEIP